LFVEIAIVGSATAFGLVGASRVLSWRARGLEEDLDVARGAVASARAVAQKRLRLRPWADPLGGAALRALLSNATPPEDDAGSRLIRALVDLDENEPWAALTAAVVIEPPPGEAWGRYRAFVCARIGVEQARRQPGHPAVMALHRELECSGDLHARAYAAWLRAAARTPEVPEEDEDVVVLSLAKRLAAEVGPAWLIGDLDRLVSRAKRVADATLGYRTA
jgi:hypothetical protein